MNNMLSGFGLNDVSFFSKTDQNMKTRRKVHTVFPPMNSFRIFMYYDLWTCVL